MFHIKRGKTPINKLFRVVTEYKEVNQQNQDFTVEKQGYQLRGYLQVSTANPK